METLQWLKTQKGFRLDSWISASACNGGHLETLKWLRSEGCPWDEASCNLAAKGGHFDVLRWLRSQDPPCPWEDTTCYWAAWGGHVDVLKWAIDNGCPYYGP